jgi:hypothetical protein
LAYSALATSWLSNEAAARKKGKKKGRGKGKKRRRPRASIDARCIATGEDAGNGVPRVAQTFRAQRSGKLTSASVLLVQNDAGADVDIEIWSVDQANAPSAFLSGATVADLPATVPPATRPLTTAFPSPATVVAGTRYALVLTKSLTTRFAASGSDPCPDGVASYVPTLDAPWATAPLADIHFETMVTA